MVPDYFLIFNSFDELANSYRFDSVIDKVGWYNNETDSVLVTQEGDNFFILNVWHQPNIQEKIKGYLNLPQN